MPIQLKLADCTTLQCAFDLVRRPNAPSLLHATVHLAPGWGQARSLRGRAVELSVTTDHDRRCSFSGHVARVRRRGTRDTVELWALGPGAERDKVRRSRCFSSASGDPVPAHELPGLRAAFAGAEGLECLQVLLANATQWNETDLAFLVRLATLSGCVVLTEPTLRIVRETGQPVLAIAPDDLVEDTRVEDYDDAPPGDECLTADEATGAVAGQPAVGHVPGQAAANGERHQHSHAALLPGDDQARADVLAAAGAAASERVVVALRDPAPGPGQVVKLPGIAGDFVVRTSVLTFAPERAADPVLNQVGCESGHRLYVVPRGETAATRTITGQVCAVLAGDRQLRLRVVPPWHLRDRVGDPATWPGLWCRVPQPAHGGHDLPHGAMYMPCALDWVDVAFDPGATLLARVTGAVANEHSSLVGDGADPAVDVVLLRTPDGHGIVARKQGRVLVLEITAPGDPSQMKLRAALDGDSGAIHLLAPNGKVEVRANDVEVHASNLLRLNAARVEVHQP